MYESGYFPSGPPPLRCCASCALGIDTAVGGRKMGSRVPKWHMYVSLPGREDRHEEWDWKKNKRRNV